MQRSRWGWTQHTAKFHSKITTPIFFWTLLLETINKSGRNSFLCESNSACTAIHATSSCCGFYFDDGAKPFSWCGNSTTMTLLWKYIEGLLLFIFDQTANVAFSQFSKCLEYKKIKCSSKVDFDYSVRWGYKFCGKNEYIINFISDQNAFQTWIIMNIYRVWVEAF